MIESHMIIGSRIKSNGNRGRAGRLLLSAPVLALALVNSVSQIGCQSSDTLGSNVTGSECTICDSCCADDGETLALLATGQQESYAEGDDGNFEFGTTGESERFQSCGDGTVLDTATGLMWLADASCLRTNGGDFETDGIPDGHVAWAEALRFVREINAGSYPACAAGYDDWHLPNARELESLVNSGQAAPNEWLMDEGFQLVEGGAYWSSTTYSGLSDTLAFVVDFQDGTLSHVENKSRVASSVLPVRQACGDGQPAVAATGQFESFADGDDGGTLSGVAVPEERFVDNGDGTVTDSFSGLMWMRDVSCQGSGSWEQAMAAALSFNRNRKVATCEAYTAIHTDWRLPNRRELLSVIDFSQNEPALPADHPFANLDAEAGFWTSTTYARNTNMAWYLDIATGDVEEDAKSNRRYIWFVRTAD